MMQNEEFEEEVFVDVNSLPLRPPQPMIPPEKATRRPWHPVMWDDSLVAIPQHEHRDAEDENEPVCTVDGNASGQLLKNTWLQQLSTKYLKILRDPGMKRITVYSAGDHKIIEVNRRPRWEAPFITFAEAEKLRIKNSHNPTELEREMVSPKLLKAISPQPQSRGEYPHKQRIRNLRRLIADGKVKPTPETLIFFLCNKFAISDDRQKKVVV